MHEKLRALSSRLYHTNIRTVESHAIVNKRLTDSSDFIIWHDQLDYLGYNMMYRIIENLYGLTLKNQNILKSKKFFCVA